MCAGISSCPSADSAAYGIRPQAKPRKCGRTMTLMIRGGFLPWEILEGPAVAEQMQEFSTRQRQN